MSSNNLTGRRKFLFRYIFLCALCLGTTVLQIWFPVMAIAANANQIGLLLVTACGLLPEFKGTSGFLTRAELMCCVVISVAVNIGCYAFLHRTAGIHDATEFGGSISFVDAIYFSVVTFTTLGFGDLQPLPGGRIFAAIQALSGYVYLGIAIGLAVNGFNPLSQRHDDQDTNA